MELQLGSCTAEDGRSAVADAEFERMLQSFGRQHPARGTRGRCAKNDRTESGERSVAGAAVARPAKPASFRFAAIGPCSGMAIPLTLAGAYLLATRRQRDLAWKPSAVEWCL